MTLSSVCGGARHPFSDHGIDAIKWRCLYYVYMHICKKNLLCIYAKIPKNIVFVIKFFRSENWDFLAIIISLKNRNGMSEVWATFVVRCLFSSYFVCLFVFLSYFRLRVWVGGLSVCLSVCLFVYLFVCLFVCLFLSFQTNFVSEREGNLVSSSKLECRIARFCWTLPTCIFWHKVT